VSLLPPQTARSSVNNQHRSSTPPRHSWPSWITDKNLKMCFLPVQQGEIPAPLCSSCVSNIDAALLLSRLTSSCRDLRVHSLSILCILAVVLGSHTTVPWGKRSNSAIYRKSSAPSEFVWSQEFLQAVGCAWDAVGQTKWTTPMWI